MDSTEITNRLQRAKIEILAERITRDLGALRWLVEHLRLDEEGVQELIDTSLGVIENLQTGVLGLYRLHKHWGEKSGQSGAAQPSTDSQD